MLSSAPQGLTDAWGAETALTLDQILAERLSQGTPPMYLCRGDQGHFAVLREKLRWGE